MNGETKRKPVLLALLIATFLTAIEGTIVSTAMPKIVNDLGGSQLFTWVISVYLLATVISTPVFGKMADLYGRKSMFTIGAIIFLVGSMLSGLSQTMGQLVLFRMVQGLGAGALTTIPYTIIGDMYTFEQRAKIQGWISSVWGIAGIVGPLAGGMIVDTVSWHWIFYLNLPFGIIALILLWTSFHEKVEAKKRTIDYAGILTFALSMSSFLYGLTLLKEQKELTSYTLLFFGITVIGMLLFIRIEMKSKEPMIPLELFSKRYITVSNFAGFLLGFILVTVTYYIPLWVQGVKHLNATYSGFAMLPMSITWPLASILCGKWLTKHSVRKLTMIGIFFVVAGCFGMTFFHENMMIATIMIVIAIIGFGFGLALTSFTVAVQSSVDWSMRGAAIGSNNLMRTLGQTIGISVSSLWLSDELSGRMLENSLHHVFWVLFSLAVLAVCIASLLSKKKKEESLA
ncbi:MDR family MFS transporter [Bacillus sp. NPDC094106]|uniref:MDR family MFS transporter n=1 Tax=Bacillus sp. NPDC094106 TaxID=3363949 RepID=UPI00381873D5